MEFTLVCAIVAITILSVLSGPLVVWLAMKQAQDAAHQMMGGMLEAEGERLRVQLDHQVVGGLPQELAEKRADHEARTLTMQEERHALEMELRKRQAVQLEEDDREKRELAKLRGRSNGPGRGQIGGRMFSNPEV